MLRYMQPANWFFFFMAMAICSYIAYNFNTNRVTNTARPQAVAASLFRQIVR